MPLAIASACLLFAQGCFFGGKLVPAGTEPEAQDGPQSRSTQEQYECMQALGAYRDGLNVADRNVIAVACGMGGYGSSAVGDRLDVEEFIYSEVDPDPIYHGIHLIFCSQDQKASTYYHIMEKCRLSYEIATPQAFEASVASYPGLGDLDRETLMWSYNAAALWLSQESQKWAESTDFNPRDREIFYDVPHVVMNTYWQQRSAYQDIYNTISVFRSSFAYQPFGAQVPQDCIPVLTRARADYLERSTPTKQTAWNLMSTGLGYWITENLVLCHLGLDDWAGALAESEILQAERREVALFERIYVAVATEILEDQEWASKVSGNLGVAQGLVMPYKPTSCGLDCLTVPSKMFASGRPDWESVIAGMYPHLSVVRGEIQSIEDNGKMATITWAAENVSWNSWSCYDTSTIDSVTAEGHLVYARNCFPDSSPGEVRPPAVTLPASQIEGLSKGQKAEVVVDASDPTKSTLVFACKDKEGGMKVCTRVEEILFE